MATLLFAWFAHFDVSNERIKSSHYQILCNACDTNGNIITSAYKEVRQCSYTCKCYARLHTRAPTSHLDQSRFALYFVAIREAMAVIVGSILCILNSFFPPSLTFLLTNMCEQNRPIAAVSSHSGYISNCIVSKSLRTLILVLNHSPSIAFLSGFSHLFKSKGKTKSAHGF